MQVRSQRLVFYLVVLFGIICLSTPYALAETLAKWTTLRSSAPPNLLEQVNKDYAADINPEQPVDVGQMQLMVVNYKNAKPLYLINTRLSGKKPETNLSCGQSGCLFYGYTRTNNKFTQVLNGYINDFQLQNAPPVIQPTEQIVNQLPCLQLTFYKSQSDQLLRSELCFDGKEYQPTASPVVLE